MISPLYASKNASMDHIISNNMRVFFCLKDCWFYTSVELVLGIKIRTSESVRTSQVTSNHLRLLSSYPSFLAPPTTHTLLPNHHQNTPQPNKLSNMPNVVAQYETEFTSVQQVTPACDRCQTTYPVGTQMHYMRDARNPNKSGRHLCDGCHDYYLSKATTRRITGTGELSILYILCGFF